MIAAFAVRRQQCHSSSWRQLIVDQYDRRVFSTRTTTTPCSLQLLFHNATTAAFQDRSSSASASSHLHHQPSSLLLSSSKPYSARWFHNTSVIQENKKRHDNSDRRQRRQGQGGQSSSSSSSSGNNNNDNKNTNVDFDFYNRTTTLKKQQQQQQQQSNKPTKRQQRPQRAFKGKWNNNNNNNSKIIRKKRSTSTDLFERFDSRDNGNNSKISSRTPQRQQRRGRDDNDDSFRPRRHQHPQEKDEQQQRRQLRTRQDLSSSSSRQQQQPRQPLRISSIVFDDEDDDDDEYNDSNNKFTKTWTNISNSNNNSLNSSSSSPRRDNAVGRQDDTTRTRRDLRQPREDEADTFAQTISRRRHAGPSKQGGTVQQEAAVPVAQHKKKKDVDGYKSHHHHIQRPVSFFPPHALDVFVSCLPGLEPVLGNELTRLGIRHKLVKNGANLILKSDDSKRMHLMDCSLYLGSASQILIRCGRPFSARALGELQRKVALLPWQDILLVNQQQQQQQQHAKKNKRNDDDKDTTTSALANIHVKVTASKSRLLHTTAIRDRVIEGIQESLSKMTTTTSGGNDTDTDTSSVVTLAAPIHLVVRVVQDRVLISIDATGGTPLHQRGYRLETGKAPLREDLAYAMLYSAGWTPPLPISMHGDSSSSSSSSNHDSTWNENGAINPYHALLDPLCGSGTIPIEAASIIAGLPPGRLRPAPLQGTTLYDPKAWKELVAKALKQSRQYHQVNVKKNMISIAASDRNEGVIEIAKSNAKRAGVLDMLDIQHAALSTHPWLQNDDNDEDINLAKIVREDDITNGAAIIETHPTTAALAADKSLLIATNLPFGRRLSGGPRKKSRTEQFLPLYQTLAARINGLLWSRSRTPNNDKDNKKHDDEDDESNNHPVSSTKPVLAAICLTNDPHLLHRSGCQLPPFQSKLSMLHGGILVSAMFASNEGTGGRSADPVHSVVSTSIAETQHGLHDPTTSS